MYKITSLMLFCTGTDAGIMFLTYDLLISSARQTKQEAAAAKAAREQQARHEIAGNEVNDDASDQTCAGVLEFGEATQIPLKLLHPAALTFVGLDLVSCCWRHASTLGLAGKSSRLRQIVEWLGGDQFEGALIFGEHGMSDATCSLPPARTPYGIILHLCAEQPMAMQMRATRPRTACHRHRLLEFSRRARPAGCVLVPCPRAVSYMLAAICLLPSCWSSRC